MFFYLGRKKEVRTKTVKMRDEWGTLREYTLLEGAPRITEKDLADALGVDLILVLTHRRRD